MDPQNNPPQLIPVEISPPPKQFHIVPLSICFIVILIITALGAYYLGTKQAKPEKVIQTKIQNVSPSVASIPSPTIAQNKVALSAPFPTLTTNEQSTWQKYNNKDVGLSFVYPNQVMSNGSNYKLEIFETNGENDATPLKADQEITIGVNHTELSILSILKYASNLSPQVWWVNDGVKRFQKIDKEAYDMNPYPSPTPYLLPTFTVSNTTVDQQTAVHVVGSILSTPGFGGNMILTIVNYKSFIYLFIQSNISSTDGNMTELSSKTLSTVKFVE